MIAEKIILNEERNVSLTAYIQEVDGEFGFLRRPAMLVLPGGGYAMCSDREADAVATAYLQAGFQTFILRYSVGSDKIWPQPLEDYEQTMELIKENAEKWHVDTAHISVVGFSAGGHLAACAATMAKNKPMAAILVYPAIVKDILHICSIDNLPEVHTAVTTETSPCFLVAARDDRTVNVKNTLLFQLALEEKGIPFEGHIYSFGGHGFSTARAWINTNSVSERVPSWVEDSIGWLKELGGELTRAGFTESNLAVGKNGDFAPVLSIGCSLRHIRKQNEEVQELLLPLFTSMEAVANARGYSVEELMTAMGENTIRELMEMLQILSEVMIGLDKQLHEIINHLE